MPTYTHLVDSYSEKVKNEWKLVEIKVEDSEDVNIEASLRVKQEDVDDSSVIYLVDESCSTNSNMVMTLHFFAMINLVEIRFELLRLLCFKIFNFSVQLFCP